MKMKVEAEVEVECNNVACCLREIKSEMRASSSSFLLFLLRSAVEVEIELDVEVWVEV